MVSRAESKTLLQFECEAGSNYKKVKWTKSVLQMTDAQVNAPIYDRKVKFFFQCFLGDRVPNELKPEKVGDVDTSA